MSGKSYWFRNQRTFSKTQQFTSTQLISGEITIQVESVGGAEESPPLPSWQLTLTLQGLFITNDFYRIQTRNCKPQRSNLHSASNKYLMPENNFFTREIHDRALNIFKKSLA